MAKDEKRETRDGGLGTTLVLVRKGDFERPAKNVAVVYSVIKGPVTLDGGSDPVRREVRTDARGEATVDLTLTEPGYALIAVELKKDPTQRVFFETVTEGVVDRLSLYGPPCLDKPGVCEAEIVAVDYLGDPVEGATLLFEAVQSIDTTAAGKVGEVGAGRYRGKVEIRDRGLLSRTQRTRGVERCRARTGSGIRARLRANRWCERARTSRAVALRNRRGSISGRRVYSSAMARGPAPNPSLSRCGGLSAAGRRTGAHAAARDVDERVRGRSARPLGEAPPVSEEASEEVERVASAGAARVFGGLGSRRRTRRGGVVAGPSERALLGRAPAPSVAGGGGPAPL